ncbi:hypothetical protein SNOG_06936 [Parastagonospora nodorum SN15]|uniref:Uncharacterized protein n=1 Tax=Phaeosphaeria nodorum (strain SN15 / ATCC MYA-4574 / FGSC 10173) TaxID=321614 RepID=Q0UMS8_PHANO|nr:hypothetical protein SNOG_06936 [Parastagonospora nodorum SN15]EAT85587.1 hypothetical protein SNOG_06936 [Parastagonospora nodorum SN15]
MFSSAKSFIPVSSGGKLPWYHKAERYTKITDHTSATNDHFPVKEIIRIVALENDANPWPAASTISLLILSGQNFDIIGYAHLVLVELPLTSKRQSIAGAAVCVHSPSFHIQPPGLDHNRPRL